MPTPPPSNSNQENGSNTPRYSSHGKHRDDKPLNRDPNKATVAEVEARLADLLIKTHPSKSGSGIISSECPNFKHGDEIKRPFLFGEENKNGKLWMHCQGDCEVDELWTSLKYDPPSKHGGARAGAGRPKERIVCGIDHTDPEFDAVTLREKESARRILELEAFAYVHGAFHVRSGNLWTRHNHQTVRDGFHQLVLKKLNLCKPCRDGGRPTVFALAYQEPIEVDYKGLVLVKTVDQGFKVIDVTADYQVRDPVPTDYLTKDQYLDLDLTLSDIEIPRRGCG